MKSPFTGGKRTALGIQSELYSGMASHQPLYNPDRAGGKVSSKALLLSEGSLIFHIYRQRRMSNQGEAQVIKTQAKVSFTFQDTHHFV